MSVRVRIDHLSADTGEYNTEIQKRAGGIDFHGRVRKNGGARLAVDRLFAAMPLIPGRRLGVGLLIAAVLGVAAMLVAYNEGTPAAGHVPPTLVFAEPDVDRPSGDWMRIVAQTDDVAFCATACIEQAECRSFTFVRRGILDPQPICFLKRERPAPNPNPCCTSGIIPGR
jgi:hypothetical protein